ncbi:MAG TPA: hypothetical protein GX733_07550 [Tissierellia bacterium]|jgi:cell division protein FtsB|nr:hypothetical protein [Tissierellia bacterium]
MRKLDFDEFDKLYNEDIEARHRWKKEKLAKQKQRQRIQGYLLYGIITLLAFAVVANIINGYVHMNRIKYGNASLQAEIETLHTEIEALEKQIEEKTNAMGIREYAQKELGMIPADQAERRQVQVIRTFTLKRNTQSAIVMEEHESFPAQGQ